MLLAYVQPFGETGKESGKETSSNQAGKHTVWYLTSATVRFKDGPLVLEIWRTFNFSVRFDTYGKEARFDTYEKDTLYPIQTASH